MKPDSAQQQLKKAKSLESFFKSTAIGENQSKPTAEDDGNNLIEKFSPAHQVHQQQHSTICAVAKENVRMRQAIRDAVLTLTQWIHQTKEQSDNVTLLVNMMKESAQSQSKLREDVEAMAIQMKMREFKWAAERLAFQEEDRQNQQMILDLQKENWKLKSFSFV
ncbi:uncharacterized protein LOC124338347 [Daphnia pulicaria]|uniref:uncharacterized protein LOC124338347 n=1 Tax=Daphnia pulicaria TaxID=35523 RepID=UPI001EEBABBA|nr:uncharacterized protein LOC124338347 [Daphnia pulicaria]